MNPKEASEFEGRVAKKCHEVSQLSLREVKKRINSSHLLEREKTIYRLEYQYRINGGETPYRQILRKIADDNNLVVDGESKTTFTVP